MIITGAIRCKNGGKWIEECVSSLLLACQSVVILDDHSTDNTVELVKDIPGVTVIPSPFSNMNEARDKTFLTSELRKLGTEWVVGVDADEILLDPGALRGNIDSGRSKVYQLSFLFLWDTPNQIRVDGIYNDFWRASVFHLPSTNGLWYEANPEGPNLHCNWIPTDIFSSGVRTDPKVRIKHYGPMLREDRIAKYNFYRSVDPDNEAEDNYRHSVLGDLPEFPADASYRHGGPLTLVPWDEKCN